MGNFNSVRGGSFDRSTGKVVGGGESPSAFGNDAHTHAYRFGIRSAADFAILGTECAAALSDDACVGVSCTAQRRDVQGPVGDVVHGGENQIYHSDRSCRSRRPYGATCARSSAFFTACNSFNNPRSLVDSSAFAPSDFASFGLSCTSMNTPSTPAATAALDSTGINSGCPPLTAGPLSSACEDGNCTECVASKTTGANFRMIGSDRISTTRLL